MEKKGNNTKDGTKDGEVHWVDCGNGLMEGGTDESSLQFGKTSAEWEALQKHDLDRDPQFNEKLNRDTEELYAQLGETPEEKEERKKRDKTDEFWRQKHIQELNMFSKKAEFNF